MSFFKEYSFEKLFFYTIEHGSDSVQASGPGQGSLMLPSEPGAVLLLPHGRGGYSFVHCRSYQRACGAECKPSASAQSECIRTAGTERCPA